MSTFIKTLFLLTSILLLSSCEKNETGTSAKKPAPVSGQEKTPPVPETTANIVKKIENGFKNLTCKSTLNPKSQPLDEKGVLFDAGFNCKSDLIPLSDWQIEGLYKQLTAIDENISLLSDRKDVHQTDLNMIHAIQSAISLTLYDLKKYHKNFERDLNLARQLLAELKCFQSNDFLVPYRCPADALEKFTELYVNLFAGVDFGAVRVSGIDYKILRDSYAPQKLRRGVLAGICELLKAKYPPTFTVKSGTAPAVKQTTITFWIAWDLSAIFTGHALDDFDRTEMSAAEIRNVMNNISLLAAQGNGLVQGLHDAQMSSWLDVRFTSVEKDVRQVDEEGHRFFVKIHKPMTLESLIKEATITDQISTDLKAALDLANSLRPGELKVWLDNYSLDSMDGSDYLGGMFNSRNAKEIAAQINKLPEWMNEYDRIQKIAVTSGKKLKVSFAVRSSIISGIRIEQFGPAAEENILQFDLTLPRGADWDVVFSRLRESVTKKATP